VIWQQVLQPAQMSMQPVVPLEPVEPAWPVEPVLPAWPVEELAVGPALVLELPWVPVLAVGEPVLPVGEPVLPLAVLALAVGPLGVPVPELELDLVLVGALKHAAQSSEVSRTGSVSRTRSPRRAL
jgi:hypothetical protein